MPPGAPSRRRARPRGGLLSAVAGLLALSLAGCGGDLSLRHDSPASGEIHDLWVVMVIGSFVILAAVGALLALAVRRRRRARPGEPPERTEEPGPRRFVVVAGIVVPSLLLAGLLALTVLALPRTSQPAAASSKAGGSRLVVDVVARQWFWDVAYPGGRVRSANEIHLPVGRPVTIRVRSRDVVHSLWVPRLNRKIDAVPGRTSRITFEATSPGVFRGRCAEFCGLQHAHMGLWVVAQRPADFRQWLEAEARPPAEPATPELARGRQVFLGSACVYCHTIAGTNASGRVGPDLTHVASRISLAAAAIPNSRGYLAGWIVDPQHLKPGTQMPGTDLTGPELQALLDYLESLK